MRDLLSAEWRKAWTGRSWLVLLCCGGFMCLITSFGYASQDNQAIEQGTATASSATGDVVRSWMMMLLFAALFGAVVVGREFSAGTIGRSVLLSGGRGRLFGAKLAVGAVLGALYGAIAVVLGLLSAWGTLSGYGRQPQFTGGTWLTVLGVFLCSLLAAPWGVFLGWLLRNQLAAVATVLGLTLLVEPALQRLVPPVGKYLMTIAMSSVYRDRHTDLLSEPVALLVIAGWLLAAGLAARALVLNRDIS
jgi:ABC-2 type transport system permease protein